MEIDVLIPEKGGVLGEVVLASLKSHGLKVARIDDSAVANDAPGYVRLQKATLGQYHPKMVIPVFRAEELSLNKDIFPSDTILPFSSADIIQTLDLKASASALASALNIPQPRMYQDSDLDSISTYPVVFKRNEGLSGSGVYFPGSRAALDRLVSSTCGKPHIVSDYIEGDNVSVDALRTRDGYFRAECYKVTNPPGKGVSTEREPFDSSEMVGYLRQMLERVDFEGVCGADFRLDSQGRLYFLECNPRFTGGLQTQIDNGFDLPYLLWTLFSQNPLRSL